MSSKFGSMGGRSAPPTTPLSLSSGMSLCAALVIAVCLNPSGAIAQDRQHLIAPPQTDRTFTILEHVQAVPMTEQELRETAGQATAIEYGLIAAGIAVAIIAAVSLIGDDLTDLFASFEEMDMEIVDNINEAFLACSPACP